MRKMSSFQNMISDDPEEADGDAGGDEDNEISRLKKQLAASQLDARKSLQIAKKTRAMCDRMVEMLKESGVEQLEPPRSI